MMNRTFNTVVVGTGAAGLCAAVRLKEAGISVAVITEGIMHGTSRNTGSDKQTYYKLGLGGSDTDSVRKMAADLFSCGAVDGDNALCEAACSARAFSYLCEAGVPFPFNEYGEYIGYKTDHDPYARATSAGPLTSKYMVEALMKRAKELNTEIADRLYAVKILTDSNGVIGLACLNTDENKIEYISAANVVLATGGPAGIYESSVYPACHTGSSSLAISAGAEMQNLTEWQYGLASVAPRWNVSGTYMQVLPRVVSVGDDGEREFLADTFGNDIYAALSALFRKGYQWPFDCRRAFDGSSLIDLAVYKETAILGREVFLDYTKNPFGLESISFELLDDEAKGYLKANGADFGTPIERLLHMNLPAAELYRSNGIDLSKDKLKTELCVQHCNGGIAVDSNWQTSVKGLYAVGEAAGTHGITRPGGSALNAGQTGAMRAALHIAHSERKAQPSSCLKAEQEEAFLLSCGEEAIDELIADMRKRMSANAAAIRNKKGIEALLNEASRKLAEINRYKGPPEKRFRAQDMLITDIAVLSAMLDYINTVGEARGSCIYDGCPVNAKAAADKIQQVRLIDGKIHITWRNVRPIPEESSTFEAVWRKFREELQ